MVLRVLVVDDDKLIRSALRRVLAESCELTMVPSGAEALALLDAGERYDCILCDLIMPDMTGFELYAVLSLKFPEVVNQLIFLSGAAEAAREFLKRIPNQVLEKPFEVAALRAIVERSRRG